MYGSTWNLAQKTWNLGPKIVRKPAIWYLTKNGNPGACFMRTSNHCHLRGWRWWIRGQTCYDLHPSGFQIYETTCSSIASFMFQKTKGGGRSPFHMDDNLLRIHGILQLNNIYIIKLILYIDSSQNSELVYLSPLNA